MPVNADKVHLWKADVAKSVDFYNQWFLNFAPRAYRETRLVVSKSVEQALISTNNLRDITPPLLRANPSVLSTLRMATAPPIARDRLSGLADVSRSLVENMEDNGRVPPRIKPDVLYAALERIGRVIMQMADEDIFPWLKLKAEPTEIEIRRAATIIADRLCGMNTNPIIRNEQEARQLEAIRRWLEERKYSYIEPGSRGNFDQMRPGTFTFRLNVLGKGERGGNIRIPVDVVVMPTASQKGDLPLLIEAKSAGDYANTNKRRKEEAQKVMQLRRAHGNQVLYILFLCGYFDTPYLGYEASEGIDWVWEHRIDDLEGFGL